MKKCVIEKLIHLSKDNWDNNSKLKVLIQTNDYFTISAWKKNLSNSRVTDSGIEFKFTNRKIDFLKLANTANAIFCYGMSKYVNWQRSDLHLVYFGLNGIEFVDFSSFDSNTEIFCAQGFAAEAIAEYTLLSALILNRKLQYAFKNNVKKLWSQSESISKPFCSLEKKLIGIMGLGKNGSCIAKKFKQNDCTIYAFDEKTNCANPYIDRWFQPDKLHLFLKEIDFLIVILPLNKSTYHYLDMNRLKLLKSDCCIINVSRGNVIDEQALITMLKEKRIAGAVLDVFSTEPLPKSSKFWKLPNVLVTPHVAGNVNLFVKEIQSDFINKLTRYCI